MYDRRPAALLSANRRDRNPHSAPKSLAPDLRAQNFRNVAFLLRFRSTGDDGGSNQTQTSALTMGGASTRAISSQNSACSINVALRPPYSLGQETAAQRLSWSFRCQARRYGNDSSRGFSHHSFQSFGAFAASHARNSSRNADSSAASLSPWKTLPSQYPFRAALRGFSFQDPANIAAEDWLRCRSFAQQSPANRIRAVPILFPQIFFQNLPVAVWANW